MFGMSGGHVEHVWRPLAMFERIDVHVCHDWRPCLKGLASLAAILENDTSAEFDKDR